MNDEYNDERESGAKKRKNEKTDGLTVELTESLTD